MHFAEERSWPDIKDWTHYSTDIPAPNRTGQACSVCSSTREEQDQGAARKATCWHTVSSSPRTLNVLLICKSNLKSAISSMSVIESESGEVTPAWWRRAFIMLCSGLYHPACLDGVQHVLSQAWRSHSRAPYIFYIYISTTCWPSQCHADDCMSTHHAI